MRLPPTKKLLREDIKDAPKWVGPLIETINSFMENVYQALNGNITFSENVRSFVKELTYKTTSLYPVADDIEFPNDLKIKASGVVVLQAVERSTYTPVAVPGLAWVEDNGTIRISALSGLQASKTYTIRLLVS